MINSAIHSLFPSCRSQSSVQASKNVNYSSSITYQVLTAIVLAVIIGIAAALTTYFLTHRIVTWTVLAGSSSALIIGLVFYVILRCTLRGKDQQRSPIQSKKQTGIEVKKNAHFSDKDWTGLIIKDIHIYPGDLPKEQQSQLSNKKVDNVLQIDVKPYSAQLTIRKQNMFESGAQVLVNAANIHLQGGSGIDGDIHTQAGPMYSHEHKVELKNQYGVNGYVQGHAAMLGSGKLREKNGIENVIVVAGPAGETTAQKTNELYSCYYNSLILAHIHRKKSIAFPTISTGIFGFNKMRAAAISLRAVYDFITHYPDSPLQTISIHYLGENNKTLEAYQAAMGHPISF